MPEYRRFIAYFYEYIDGRKQRSAGFAKVELRGGIWRILFRLTAGNDLELPVKIYGFVREGGYLLGLPMGAMRTGQEAAQEWAYQADIPIKGEYLVEDLAGIWVQSSDGRSFLTVWDEEDVDPEKFVLELPERKEDGEGNALDMSHEPRQMEGEQPEPEYASGQDGERRTEREREPMEPGYEPRHNGEERAEPTGNGSERKYEPGQTGGGMSDPGRELSEPDGGSMQINGRRPEAERGLSGPEYEPRHNGEERAESTGNGSERKYEPGQTGERMPEREREPMEPGYEPRRTSERRLEQERNPMEQGYEPEQIGESRSEREREPMEPGYEPERIGESRSERERNPMESGYEPRQTDERMPDPDSGSMQINGRRAELGYEPEQTSVRMPEREPNPMEPGYEPRRTDEIRSSEHERESSEPDYESMQLREERLEPERRLSESLQTAGEKTERDATVREHGRQHGEKQGDGCKAAEPQASKMPPKQSGTWDLQDLFRSRPRCQPFQDGEIRNCVMLRPCDIVWLQQRGWQVGRSSFLQHGFHQYRHLLLGALENDGYIIGVPGVYNPQEKYMAGMFGFDHFKESGTRRNNGMFGYWYRRLERRV